MRTGHDAASSEPVARGGAPGSVSLFLRNCSRMVVITAGSRITLRIRMSPPYLGHMRGSTFPWASG